MSRGKKLLILLAVLVLAIVAVLVVAKLTEPELLPLSSESGETILQVDVSAMTDLKWTWGTESFDFSYSGSAWTCNVQADYVPDTAKMAKILVELSDIRAEKVINQPQDLSIYGLDQPTCTVTTGSTVLKFGDASSLNDTHYMSIGDGKVYMVDSTLYGCFSYTREELVQFETIPEMTELTGIAVENKNGTMVLENLGENDKTYSSHYTWFVKDDPTMISQDVVAGIETYLQDMQWLKCVDSNAQDLAAYGLDAPAVKLTATDAEGDFSFWIGNEETQGYYACVAGSNRVYLMDTTAAQIFDAIGTDMLACTDVLKMDWTTVTSVELTVDGQTYVFTAGENSTWTLNGEEVDGQTVFDAVNLMVSEAGEELTVEGLTAEMQLKMTRNTESFNQVTLTFYRHDGTNCIMQLDDHAPMLVLRDDMVALKEAFTTLILG